MLCCLSFARVGVCGLRWSFLYGLSCFFCRWWCCHSRRQSRLRLRLWHYIYICCDFSHSARYVEVESDIYWVREKTKKQNIHKKQKKTKKNVYIYQNESRFYINLKRPIMRMKTDLIAHFDSLSNGRPINNSSRWHYLKITRFDRNPWSWSSVKRQVCLSQFLTTQ